MIVTNYDTKEKVQIDVNTKEDTIAEVKQKIKEMTGMPVDMASRGGRPYLY